MQALKADKPRLSPCMGRLPFPTSVQGASLLLLQSRWPLGSIMTQIVCCGRRICAGVFVTGSRETVRAAFPARPAALRRNPTSRVFHYVTALQVRLITASLLVTLAAHPASPAPVAVVFGVWRRQWQIRTG